MIYNFKIDNDYLSQTEYFDGVSGNKNVYICNFEISCHESGAIWFAVFKKGDENYITPITDGKCMFPYECLEEPCSVYLGCYAECENNKRISTNWLPLKVESGAYSQGTAPGEPSADLWETLLSNSVPVIGENGNWFTYDMQENEYIDTGFPARGERGIQGEKGDKGDTGVAGYTPQKGVDYFTPADIAKSREEALALLCPKAETTDLVVPDAISHNAIGYKIYGNSVQESGTPTPENPIAPQSVGDLVTDTEDEHYGKYKISFNVNNEPVNIYLNEPLRKIGNYADYIDYSRGRVIRNVRAVNLGTLNYFVSQPAGGQKTFMTNNPLTKVLRPQSNSSPAVAKCDVYRLSVASIIVYGPNAPDMAFSIGSEGNLRISNSEYNDAVSFKQAMNSAYLYYAMNPETEEAIELPPIPLIYNETNTITFGTAVQPSSVKIKYYQDINKVIANLQALILNQ